MSNTAPCLHPRQHGVKNHIAGSQAAIDCANGSLAVVTSGTPTTVPASTARPNSRFISPDQLKEFRIEETTIRGNPALTVTFPAAPDFKQHFVADPGIGMFRDQIIMIAETPDDKANLSDYIEHGQDGYGSPGIESDAGGSLAVYDGSGMAAVSFDELKGVDPEFTEEDLNSTDLEWMADFDSTYLASDGRPIQHHILPAIAETKLGGAWLRSHANPAHDAEGNR